MARVCDPFWPEMRWLTKRALRTELANEAISEAVADKIFEEKLEICRAFAPWSLKKIAGFDSVPFHKSFFPLLHYDSCDSDSSSEGQ